MSNYFCDHIQLEGLLYDTKHELLAIAKFLIIYCPVELQQERLFYLHPD